MMSIFWPTFWPTYLPLSDFVLVKTSNFTIWCQILALQPAYPNIGHHLWMSPNDYNILDQFSIKLEIKQRILNRLNFLILTYFQVGK